MNKSEPPARFVSMLIGKNSRGQWVVRSEDGLYGGLFINRGEALRYALFENGHHQNAVVMVSGPLELNPSAPASAHSPNRAIFPHRRSRKNNYVCAVAYG